VDTRKPLVSIIIPSLNQARFIEETIQSVLAQSYPHLEIIVVDGGSRDGTVDLLKEYDGAIRWVSEPDHGHADAVNKGIQLAGGEIIGWLNSDDVYYFRDSISTVVEAFNNSFRADIIYGDAVEISENSTLLRMYFALPYNKDRMLRANYITQPTVFLRREVALAEQLKSYLSLDYEYWLRLGEKGYRFQHVPRILAGDRQYKGRASILRRSAIDAEILQYRKQYRHLLNDQRLLRLMDRSLQATCRLKGILSIFNILVARDYRNHLAFPGKIDSFAKLLYRQIFKSSVEVF
jgi:glycosyltransferase involved in cell wall biosynthesis